MNGTYPAVLVGKASVMFLKILIVLSEKENLCLYGLPNETWDVNLPVEEVPPELPEPALGINFARDGMQEKDWLSLVAVHSDSWLLAVAFYFGARFGFGKNERYELSFLLVHEFVSFGEAEGVIMLALCIIDPSLPGCQFLCSRFPFFA